MGLFDNIAEAAKANANANSSLCIVPKFCEFRKVKCDSTINTIQAEKGGKQN